jgi:WD40 repeat protein
MASNSEDNNIKIWSVEYKKEIATLVERNGRVNSVSFSSDGKYLAYGSNDYTIKLWNV